MRKQQMPGERETGGLDAVSFSSKDMGGQYSIAQSNPKDINPKYSRLGKYTNVTVIGFTWTSPHS